MDCYKDNLTSIDKNLLCCNIAYTLFLMFGFIRGVFKIITQRYLPSVEECGEYFMGLIVHYEVNGQWLTPEVKYCLQTVDCFSDIFGSCGYQCDMYSLNAFGKYIN